MGWAARRNQNSTWNKKRVLNMESTIASPVSTVPDKVMTPAPARPDEPFVIELTFRNVWNLLCRTLKPSRSQSPNLKPIS